MSMFLIAVLVFVTISRHLRDAGHCADACGSYPRDCEDIRDIGFTVSGVYRVSPGGTPRGYEVYCDMDTDEGGWMVFQRRQNGSVDFYRGWNDYQLGFGNLAGEHWLGTIPLHTLTLRNDYQLRIDLEDWEGNKSYANYQLFRIGSSLELYKLEVAGYSGTAGDSLTVYSGHTFKTKNVPDGNNCPETMKGAWWYISCSSNSVSGSTLNGEYYQHDNHILFGYQQGRGVTWADWHGMHYSLKKTEMKIKRI